MRVQDLDVYKDLFSKPYYLKKTIERRKERFEALEASIGYISPQFSDCPKGPKDVKKSSVENLAVNRFNAQELLSKAHNEFNLVLSQSYELLDQISDKEAVLNIEARHIDGKAWKDIIAESGCSESTVYDHYKRAMKELDKLWKEKKSKMAQQQPA